MGKIEQLKQTNIQQIRECFYDNQIWTKNELSEHTGLSLAGTTNVLGELLEQQVILQTEDAQSTGGRKSKQYILNPDYAHIGTIILSRYGDSYVYEAASYDLCGEVKQQIRKETDGSLQEFEELLKQLLHADPRTAHISISIPGVCISGVVDVCDIPALEHTDLGALIRRITKIPYTIENDVNAAAIGKAHEYPQYQDLIFIYQPAAEFIGCGILINGKLYNGHTHRAGEVRYLPQFSEEEQLQLLKENPAYLLEQTIRTMHAVMDAEAVFWCSDVYPGELSFSCKGSQPQLIHVQNLHAAIVRGLYEIGKQKQMKQ